MSVRRGAGGETFSWMICILMEENVVLTDEHTQTYSMSFMDTFKEQRQEKTGKEKVR